MKYSNRIFLIPLLLNVVLVSRSLTQWSTSTKAESALFVCPGFNQSVRTFEDGSSIICGALSDSRYLQKLDPRGNKIWPQPVQIYNTPGTDNTGDAESIISDGDGGFILWWADHRGAERGFGGYFNNSLYMQAVDKYGGIRWQTGGIQISPVAHGLLGGYAVNDGSRGIILSLGEADFSRPTATNKARTWLVRYNSFGQKEWEIQIDSSTVQSQLYPSQPIKLGNTFQIVTLNGFRYYNIEGIQTPTPKFDPGGMLLLEDSIAYRWKLKPSKTDSLGNTVFTYGVTRVSETWDSLWYSEYNIIDESTNSGVDCPGGPIISDKDGGFYQIWRVKDKLGNTTNRAQWITNSGPRWKNGGLVIGQKPVVSLFNSYHKLGLFFNDGTAQLFDSTGKPLWDSDVLVIGDLENAYGRTWASDNNGGCIVAYWTILGGIYAQHTGRVGKVGIISHVETQESTPQLYTLNQNYPNPFNSTTTISLDLPTKSFALLKIYDLLGREVSTLISEQLSMGKHLLHWDGDKLASGVYLYRLQAGKFIETKKLILLK
jgi:hypothetical protein